MTSEEILAAVAAVAREHLDVRCAITPGARLVEDLGCDSLQLLTLAAEVENRFRVVLEPADEARIATIGDLVALLEEKLAQ